MSQVWRRQGWLESICHALLRPREFTALVVGSSLPCHRRLWTPNLPASSFILWVSYKLNKYTTMISAHFPRRRLHTSYCVLPDNRREGKIHQKLKFSQHKVISTSTPNSPTSEPTDPGGEGGKPWSAFMEINRTGNVYVYFNWSLSFFYRWREPRPLRGHRPGSPRTFRHWEIIFPRRGRAVLGVDSHDGDLGRVPLADHRDPDDGRLPRVLRLPDAEFGFSKFNNRL